MGVSQNSLILFPKELPPAGSSANKFTIKNERNYPWGESSATARVTSCLRPCSWPRRL